jgi:hypothetical protein
MDTSYMVFNILNEETFALEHNRYSFILLQIVPLIFVKLSFGLEVILYVVSIWTALVYALIAFLLYKISKQWILTIVWTMILVVPIHEFYYFAFSESIMAMGFSLLVYGLLNKFLVSNKVTLVQWLILFVCSVIAVFFHPYAFVYLMIVCTALILKNGLHGVLKNYSFVLLVCLVLYWFFKPKGGYDSGVLGQMLINAHPKAFIKSYVFDFYMGNFKVYYWSFFVVLVFIVFQYIKTKCWAKLMMYLSSVVLVFILCALAFHSGDGVFFMEKNLLPVCLVMVLPIAGIYETLFIKVIWKRIVLISFFILILNGMYQIHRTGLKFRMRTNVIVDAMNKMNQNQIEKGFISDGVFHYSENITPWTMPYETLIISNVQFNRSVTIKPMNVNTNSTKFENEFIGSDFTPIINLDIQPLNPQFFKPMSGTYHVIDSLIKE